MDLSSSDLLLGVNSLRPKRELTGVSRLVGVGGALVETVGLVELRVLHISLVTSLVDAAGANTGVSGHDGGWIVCLRFLYESGRWRDEVL